ncbi:hypothetical protein C2G38_1617998 [Gigaspora rosea]|uniref:Uncharacterized protein n=1 Tax=Gigaspora rosea TaxID=44941 RepID=A0A397VZU2_9GLOM|nr:hypothetical protein C2G38_1617998 [Gigaspora rosea]
MEMFASASPNLNPSLINKDQLKKPVTIPLTVAIKIFTKTLENRCIKNLSSDLINNAKSACDRYNFLVHSDIKYSQGVWGITGHWIIVNNEEWRNELDEMRQKEIQDNALNIFQKKPARKKQSKWMQQGPLENKQSILAKKKGKQEVEHVKIEQQKNKENKISWADDAEITFQDGGPLQTLNFDPSIIFENQGFDEMSKQGEGENLSGRTSYIDNEREIGDKKLDNFIGNLSIGNVELKESRNNDKEMEKTDEEENMKTSVMGSVEMCDDDKEDIRTSDIETSDENITTLDTGLIPQKQFQDAYNERKPEEKSHLQDDSDATTVSKFLLKYSKVIYNALLAEHESRQFLYEMDKKSRVSECPTGREKKAWSKETKV